MKTPTLRTSLARLSAPLRGGCPLAPYPVGETVSGMGLDPEVGTVASTGTLTVCS